MPRELRHADVKFAGPIHGGFGSPSRIRKAPQPGRVFMTGGRGFSGAKNDRCCFGARRFVTCGTRRFTTRYGSPGMAESPFRKTGRFAPKQCLGEKHVGKVMLSRIRDCAARNAVVRGVLYATGCVLAGTRLLSIVTPGASPKTPGGSSPLGSGAANTTWTARKPRWEK